MENGPYKNKKGGTEFFQGTVASGQIRYDGDSSWGQQKK